MSSDTKLVKTPHQKENYTHEQLVELAKCIKDPKYFMKAHCWIQHPVKGRMRFELFDFQEELVDVYHNHRNSVALISRQMGKSTCAAGYLLWYAMFVPDQTILIAAHKYSGAQEIMQRIRFAYETLPDYLRAGATSYNKGSLEFDNGSRIIAQATTDNTGRGMSISLAYLDEFAFVRPNIARDFWTALSPTLATGGKCIITSTPNQDDDQFAQIWRDSQKKTDEYGNETELGINSFASYDAIWDRHPDRDEEWAIVEEAKIGEEKFRREHKNEFIAFDETLVSSLKLAMMEAKEAWAMQGQVRWYKPLKAGNLYLIALDPSLGTGGDNAAIQVYELPGMNQIAEWQHNKTTIQQQVRILQKIAIYIDDETKQQSEIYYSLENNSMGEAGLVCVEEIGEEYFPGTFLSERKKHGNTKAYRKGFTTTHKSKIAACAKLKYWVETDKLEIASKNLLRELKVFISRGNSYGAKEGENDDLVMALVLIIRMAQEVTNYEDTAYEYLMEEGLDNDYDDPMPMSFL
jgi:hypothetical protein|tara:strand:- start:1243 stop:2799 length:1557 start_codon:yes stop_codon:yes gene_type:complete